MKKPFLFFSMALFLVSSSLAARAQCIYVSGDVNANDDATALADVVYSFQYLRGWGPSPPDTCNCPDAPHPFYVAGDVNGNCSFNGVDVGYLLNFYKVGNNPLSHCASCPQPQPDPDVPPSGLDVGVPDTLVIGSLDSAPIAACIGEVTGVPIWVRNDEMVAALNITIALGPTYVSGWREGTVFYPLSEWADCHIWSSGSNSQPSLLGWASIDTASNPNLNTGSDFQEVALFSFPISSDPSLIGEIAPIIPGHHPRAGVTAFCDSVGTAEWAPIMLSGSILFVGTPAGINLSEASITDTVRTGFSTQHDLIARNLGEADLFYFLSWDSSWMAIAPTHGQIRELGSSLVEVTFDAASLPPGIYSAEIRLLSNDPSDSLIILPVDLIVRDTSGAGCAYIPGDVNGNGDVNGVDITFGVNYFKGYGPAPPMQCVDCPGLEQSLYAAGDFNGDCQFDIVDITYFVNFLKGVGPALSFCPECPPAER